MKAALVLAAALLALPVAAREVGVARGPSMGIVLYDERGSCPAGATKALWVEAQGQVPGCWFEAHGRIWLFWDDGDHHGIPRTAFKFETI